MIDLGRVDGMRQARMKVPKDRAAGYYHCLSRVVDRQKKFGQIEKEKFREIMREYETFCGVRVLTYCMMSNHFHILVEVPKRPESLPSAEALLNMLDKLSCKVSYEWVKQRLESLSGEERVAERAEFLESFYRRMWDVSWFTRLVKQRFTQWYNRKEGRRHDRERRFETGGSGSGIESERADGVEGLCEVAGEIFLRRSDIWESRVCGSDVWSDEGSIWAEAADRSEKVEGIEGGAVCVKESEAERDQTT